MSARVPGSFPPRYVTGFSVTVLAVEPSGAMRALIPHTPGIEILDGSAENLPIGGSSADGAWLSTVTHHIADLPAAATELRRVLRRGAPVLIRNFFPDRTERLGLLRFFPEVRRVLSTFPTVDQTVEAFRDGRLQPPGGGVGTAADRAQSGSDRLEA